MKKKMYYPARRTPALLVLLTTNPVSHLTSNPVCFISSVLTSNPVLWGFGAPDEESSRASDRKSSILLTVNPVTI